MHKFPTFRQHRLFLTGESYAGVYVPLLAAKIIDEMQNYSLNFEVSTNTND
jgi:carboxypeptidase C (cathepsin A)